MASVEVPLARATPEREEEGHPPLLRSVSSFNAGFRFTAGSPQKQEKGREIGALGTAILAGSEEENVDSPYDRKVVHLEEELDGEEGEGGGHVGEKLVDSSSASRLSPAGWPSQVEMRWADTNSFPARKKHQCWCQLPNGEWGLGQILSKSGEECIISVLEGKVLKVNSENLLPANPEILNGVDDLMQLSYLNEPSVLYNIEYRYSQNMIYTKAGPVLVAINPFKNVNLYGSSYIEAYRCRSMDGPHVYAIAGTAMQEMIRDEVNQSIIISGESGAGKTETAKIAMQYLAALGGGSGMEYEILQTNPILEAFGNAKTSRNDNSSRFGKLIEIHFSAAGKISGAKIQTFLLEKSRVVQCAKGERSYHIFYQLCSGAPISLREKLNLRKADEFKYLRQSNCFTIPGVNDTERFCVVKRALNVVHIRVEDQEKIFEMLAAVLWLGNISFTVIDNENHVEVVADEATHTVARLIGCDAEKLRLSLSTRRMKAGNDHIVQKLTLSQAIDTRDALAKSLYASLFEWLVERINESLGVGKYCTGRSISILDIYGFESFDKNSLEQFCINYANERLQQHFNRHLFKLEQEEYVQDGIDWANVEFEDNQGCLNLFEKKPLGLLSLLDEESTFPNGTDLTFANKLKQHLSHNSFFRGERGKAFTVNHYAGEVLYDTSCFLEKNRDLLHLDSIQLLASCTQDLPKIFAFKILSQSEKAIGDSHRSTGVDSQKLSVATKFKQQLFQLMQRLENTTPHFIRCIKPNNSQLPATYKQGLVLQQLRCCGVLEVVRISRSGYPTRMSHQKFARRYGFLLERASSQDPLSVSVAILHQFDILPEMYQVGYTKLFFRTGQIGILEDTRNRTLHGILRVQSCFRGHQVRRFVKEFREGIITLQAFVHGEKTRQAYNQLIQQHRSAVVIQKQIKRRIARKDLLNIQQASIVIQSVIRGWQVRRCAQNVSKLSIVSKNENGKGTEFNQVSVKASVLAELQRRVLKAETGLREKEEENEILQQKLQQYESRWSEYECKMRSMEEVWQKQMQSLQYSLSVAKRSLAIEEDADRRSDASVEQSLDGTRDRNDLETRNVDNRGGWSSSHTMNREMSASLSVISRLAQEFEQRTQVFADDARFLVEVKSGQVEASLNPERELRRLKRVFESWKKDFNMRLRETRVILHRLGTEGGSAEKLKLKKRWWGRLNTTRMS